MEFSDSRYRSASQASLHSAHQSHEKRSTTPRLRSPSQPRLPFQSLNETSALLRSPGPLESMLKTTTETGDLGIYSISAAALSNTPRAPRTKISHKRMRRPARPYYDEVKDGSNRDDRISLPSYRDTTSEIISLYGSPGVPNTSSRRVPSFKSSGTFHSQQSNNGLHRPRSPIPYPTRLRRPRIRPSSPAWTDNGLIDHRRMIEIDRSSRRTNHGSRMHRGYRKHPRYPPLSMRPEFSRSMSSLPPRSSSAPYYGSRANPSRRPSGAGYPPPKSPYRQSIPGDRSIRSASLTSIVDMYHGRTADGGIQPLRSPNSFYYDYTEEFDKGTSSEFEYALPTDSQGHTAGMLRRDDIEDIDATNSASFKDPRDNMAITQHGSPVLSANSSEDEWVWGSSKKEREADKYDTARTSPPPVPPKTNARCSNQPPLNSGNEGVAAKPKVLRASHRRTPANTNIAIQKENNLAQPEQMVQKATIDAGIVSPNPISPAHQLRVTNSIPQLMKALPPLPDEAQYNSNPPYGGLLRGFSVPAHETSVSSPAYNVVTAKSKASASEVSSKPASCMDESTQPFRHQAPTNPMRFKVHLRSPRSGLQSKWSLESSGIPERSSSNPIPRLKLKVSRSRMSNKLMGSDRAIVRNSPLKQSNSFLELKHFPRIDVYTDRSSFGEALEEQFAQLGADKRLSNIDEGTIRGLSRQLSDQFDIPYPPSTEGIVTAELVSQPKFDSGLDLFNRRRVFDRTLYAKPLRKKSSFLRARARAMTRQKKQKGPANLSDPTPLLSESTQDSSFDDSMLAPSILMSQRIRNKTRRVKRWATEAKRAVQALMRRTLIRSQYSDSEG
ncbi:hypothetical protein FBEOM_1302 [Fusarium beomiforme]|uniref:Uncharacterized protein n=1 Tax=Fusarium beomiforme TaxID=44412 RepID=A0A9P5ATL8_9HYPO|nr:hypothetical protein FBEOM_1302 [Fusarium beomiforme]